jgi:excinuclease ABC subunit C
MGQPRLRRRLHAIADVEAIETGSELEALFLESRLIKRYLPDANLLQRNDRDYPFIRITDRDRFPRIEATLDRPSDDGTYFGPFRRRGTAGEVAELLQTAFGLRSCVDPIRPGQSACAQLDLGRCSGPCVGAIDDRAYHDRVQAASDVLRGDGSSLLAELVVRRDRFADSWRFEEAANVRDQIRALEHILGAQRRLDAVAERNLAIVAPSTRAGQHELFLVRAGQLVRQLTLGRAVRRPTILRALASSFSSFPPSVTREKVDEMHLLDAWLRRHRERAAVVEVDPVDPTRSVDEIIRAIRPRLARPA